MEGSKEVRISCRNIISTSSECILVAADYCQLELRILAHFSGDEKLLQLIQSGDDPFLHIAANVLGEADGGGEGGMSPRDVAKQVSMMLCSDG